MNDVKEPQTYLVLGQKYAYATASLILGIACFINLVGMEKAALAVIFGWLALRTSPTPPLQERRLWAKTGLVLGAIVLVMVPTVIIVYFERLHTVIELLTKLSEGR
jgi:hypothetical protein